MNKLLVLLLLAHLPIHSMDNDKGAPLESAPRYQPRSLTSLCISKLETHIRETMFPQQCALLAQVIDTQFPMPEDPYRTISKEQALGLLIALTNISQENELLRITPVSIEIKNILTEYYPGLIQELTQQILSSFIKKEKVWWRFVLVLWLKVLLVKQNGKSKFCLNRPTRFYLDFSMKK